MDKKGFSNVFFVFLFVIAFVFYIAPIYLKLGAEPIVNGTIGESALNLINSYDNVSNFKIYLDKSVELASCQALYDQGKNGGFFETNCKKKGNYFEWDVNCNPLGSLEQEYKNYFGKEIKRYLDFNPVYNYIFDKGNFLGKTENKVEKTYENVKYYINPSFSTKLKLDLNLYNDISSKINENHACFSKKDPKECIGDEKWEMEKEEKSVSFDIGTGVKCLVREGDKFDEKEVKIRFVRDFTKEDLLNTKTPNLLK